MQRIVHPIERGRRCHAPLRGNRNNIVAGAAGVAPTAHVRCAGEPKQKMVINCAAAITRCAFRMLRNDQTMNHVNWRSAYSWENPTRIPASSRKPIDVISASMG